MRLVNGNEPENDKRRISGAAMAARDEIRQKGDGNRHALLVRGVEPPLVCDQGPGAKFA